MLLHVVVAMPRQNMVERIVSLHRLQEDAQKTARRYAAAHFSQFFRFRIRAMDLSRSQVEAICYEWGRVDAEEGEPLRADRLPKPYTDAYQRGYCDGKKLAGPARDA